MGMGLSDAPDWTNQGDAKKFVIEQTLTQALNPFSSWQNGKQPEAQKQTVMTYSVQSGDTLSEIAKKYGMTLSELVQENRITNPNMVGIGMKLMIKRNELSHMVKQGETLEQIARRYAIRKEEIIARNPLIKALSNQLYVGQTLLIPLSETKPMLAGSFQARRQMAQAASRSMARSRMMNWPVEGATVTSGFGTRWGKLHKGIDLWNEKEGKTPIAAAKEGVVVEAGANRSGYGYMVVIDHGEGLQSFYAHLRKISVYLGQEVERGETIGYMGRTGDSTGYHLHFEVRQDDIPVNPIRYLTR
ncbi:MAG: peptidoglycan DD-metalloendopeptidase family protein [Clostridia bacterium]